MIDFHTHILPPSFRGKREFLRRRDATFAALFNRDSTAMATAEELVGAMDADGIDASVVLGYGWCDKDIARESNDYLLEASKRFPNRIVPFCSVHPGWGDAALVEVERCASQGAVGIGELHPSSQGVDLGKDPRLESLMWLAQQHGLPVLVHSSEPVGHAYPGKGETGPAALLAFIARYQDVAIICAHWGGGLPFYGLMPEVKATLKNVYFDTATTPLLYTQAVFPVMAQTVGAEHLLFGSDYPLVRAERVIQQAKGSLKAKDVEMVLHSNAERLLDRVI